MRSFGYMRQGGDVIRLAAGTLVYKEGPRAGQLYMISEGEVEVFKERPDGIETLATFGPGEIVGLMNVVAGSEQETSARVTKDVVATTIPRDQIRRCFASEPPWLESIFNGFVRRVRELTTAMQTLHAKNNMLRQTQVTKLYTATQVAATLSTLGDSIATRVDDRKIFVRDEMIDLLAGLLVRPRSEIERIVDVFCESGLIKMSVEIDRHRKVIELDSIKRLASFVQFVGSAKSGRVKKLMRTVLHSREKRMLVALVRYAKSLPNGSPTMARIPMAELEERLKKVTGAQIAADLVARVEQMGFIRTEGPADAMKIVFSPSELGLTLGCLEAHRKLAKVENSADDEMHERMLAGASL